jgi:hypothetical protein
MVVRQTPAKVDAISGTRGKKLREPIEKKPYEVSKRAPLHAALC